MKIQPLKHGDGWILVSGAKWGWGELVGRGSDTRPKPTFEKCWTGNAWGTDAALAMQFDTHEAAQQYAADNASQLESGAHP